MITAGYVATMAAYNAEMNRRLYDAASRLSDAERRRQRGAFWGSIHGTLNHLLWGDRVWMARFDGWERPPVAIGESAGLIADFDTLRAAREADDARLRDWAGRVTDAWLAEDQTWLSGAARRETASPARAAGGTSVQSPDPPSRPGPCDADRGGRADRRYRPVLGDLYRTSGERRMTFVIASRRLAAWRSRREAPSGGPGSRRRFAFRDDGGMLHDVPR